MAEHTMGPWQVSWSPDVTGYPRFSIHGMSGDQKRDETTLDANAHLIAAAPDLLAALEDILSGWLYIRQMHGDLYGVGWDRVEDAARAAIARARGEATR